MRPGTQLISAIVAAVALASAGSHCLARWVKLRTAASETFTFGSANGTSPAFRSGSSLSDYGISWPSIADQLHLTIRAWGVAGGSPYEFEHFQKEVPDAKMTFLVVSAYDLDEGMICDFRADIVPFSETVRTLWQTRTDWKDIKTAVSQYPMTWLRTLFPTLGRSRGVLGKLKDNLGRLRGHSGRNEETEAGPTLDLGKNAVEAAFRKGKISDWSESQMAGKVAAMKAGNQFPHGFNWLKRSAFERMVQQGMRSGKTIIVVLPVSAAYTSQIMSADLTQRFNNELAEIRQRNPESLWLSLYDIPELASNDNFCDLVHMNVHGKELVTARFQTWLEHLPPSPGFLLPLSLFCFFAW